MGVYYIAANHTKREWFHPIDLGAQKLREMMSCRRVGGAIILLLASVYTGNDGPYRGRWARDSVELIGDETNTRESERVTKEYTDITPLVVQMVGEEGE